ncbi:D-alanyl-D-alanine carboxypeptidase [Candidatus Uhrbacteria bacterium]|jgi:serine-type D-Ala-D-Ala endopeptidase (penicillin-binding protein 7)|nr:D-alanyl-D-alanine carboxypeptidase [Candidatus Uhrbacteria bacterium]
MKKFFLLSFLAALLVPQASFAISQDLFEIYDDRGDLQEAFDNETYQAIPGTASGFLIDIEDWARQYGYVAYPELADYAPEVSPATYDGVGVAPEVTAETYIVIDDASGTILAAGNADQLWPVASITKLVTAKTAMDLGLDGGGVGTVEDVDDVGGAKLWVYGGTSFAMIDLLKATLVASANNAANAVARLTGYENETFIDHMNEFAASLNLGRTTFEDPTGIELGNVSTAREVAAFASAVFADENIRRMAGTSSIYIDALNDDYTRNINSTNWLLYDHAYDDVYVTAGKTGYLPEAGWNLVVRMHPMGDDEDSSVLVVVMGSDDRRTSCDDAASLARWAWANHDWER